MMTGACFCGAVRYEVRGEAFHSTLCHCSDCRRISGAPLVAWFSVPVDGFRITEGVPKRFCSSENVVRQFCAECGTGLTYQNADLPDEIDVTTSSLNEPELVPAQDATWTRERLSWMYLSDGLPEYELGRD